MEIRSLRQEDTEDLLNAVNGAFADYIVPFQLNMEQLQFKMSSEDILPEWSAGVFDGNKMIAFIMHGMRNMDGKSVLYNAGTGTLPEYRGQGLVGKIYDHLQPLLQEHKVTKLMLEVIENNQSAIRAYEKNGFSIQRKLLCFDGVLKENRATEHFAIRPLDQLNWDTLQSFWDITPGWQSAAASMNNVSPQALGAFAGAELLAYVLFNPAKKRLYQLAVAPAHRRKGIATQLLARVQQQTGRGKVQLNNVDEAAESLKLFLEKQGLANTINQFEMIKNL